MMSTYVKWFNEIGIEDIQEVGGKNASLGEMYQNLKRVFVFPTALP